MRALGFDIETAKITPREEDVRKFRPLGIACAAVYEVDTDIDGAASSMIWHAPMNGDKYGAQLSPSGVCLMVDYLLQKQKEGMIIVTFNGLGFDFDITAEECQSGEYAKKCAELAMAHVDIGFQMLCDKGFMAGLDALSKGVGLPGKTEGMHGDLAPEMWARSLEDQEKVLKYVVQDCKTILDFYIKASALKKAQWTSRTGRINFWYFGNFVSASECLKKRLPGTSWMSEPRKREEYYSWTIRK